MKAILTCIVISNGPHYRNCYETYFRKSQELYAKKHGLDFQIIDYMLDIQVNHTSAFSYQKALVCERFPDYDYVICVDADVLINPNSPNILDFVKDENIYAVDEHAWPSHEVRDGYDGTASGYYSQTVINGVPLELETKSILNTGVMVFQPIHHKDFLRTVYDKYIRGCQTSNRGYHWEQSTLGYEIQKRGNFSLLPNEFNALWCLSAHIPSQKGTTMEEFFEKNFFIHFAANYGWTEIIPRLGRYFE